MISAWWLILIVPLSITLGVFIVDRILINIIGSIR